MRSPNARGRKGLILKLVITVLLAACVTGCLATAVIFHTRIAKERPREMKALPYVGTARRRPAPFATSVLVLADEYRPSLCCLFNHAQGTANADVNGTIVRVGL
jgi:hypothetical protein